MLLIVPNKEVGLLWWLSSKESACNARAAGDGETGSIPELGRSLEEVVATHSSIHAWRIPYTRENVHYSP